jgi:hypothetical protein
MEFNLADKRGQFLYSGSPKWVVHVWPTFQCCGSGTTPTDRVWLVCQQAFTTDRKMGEILSEEWARLTDEQAYLQEWQGTLLEQTNEASTQSSAKHTMLHRQWRRLKDKATNVRVRRETVEECGIYLHHLFSADPSWTT